jgi:hypothetical protein
MQLSYEAVYAHFDHRSEIMEILTKLSKGAAGVTEPQL